MSLDDKSRQLLKSYPEFKPAWEATTDLNVRYALLVGMRQLAREAKSAGEAT